MYLDVPLRLVAQPLKNADDKCARTHGTIAWEWFLHMLENSSEMVRQFSMEITFHRLVDLVPVQSERDKRNRNKLTQPQSDGGVFELCGHIPMSLDSQCILVHYI